jgi:hypothetical protein
MPAMKPLSIALAMCSVLPALGCQNIKSAPEGSPRVEVELIVQVDSAVYEPFDAEVDKDELRKLVQDAVLPLADVGLRFYPVPSDAYSSGDERPEYALTIHVQRFEPVLDHKLIEEEGQEPRIETHLDGAKAISAAVFERRRDNAPALLVGSMQAEGKSKADDEEPGDYLLSHETQSGEDILLARRLFSESIEESAEKALSLLQKPIDREFDLPEGKRAEP